MARPKLRLIVALLVGVASELMPVPGLLGAALVFPQGIEGDHGIAYLVLAACLNFALFFAASYYIFGLFTKPKDSN
jgi:predicted permease